MSINEINDIVIHLLIIEWLEGSYAQLALKAVQCESAMVWPGVCMINAYVEIIQISTKLNNGNKYGLIYALLKGVIKYL